MIKIYGASDDLVEIDGSDYAEDEIGCFENDVRIWFDDGTIIRVGYSKPGLGIWYVIVETEGMADQFLTLCNNEDAHPYSDVFEIAAEIVRHEVVEQEGA